MPLTNWCGTSDAKAINDTIIVHNQPNGTVTFMSFLKAPNPQATPIQNVITPPTSTPSVEEVQFWTVAVISILIIVTITAVFLKANYFKSF